MTLWWCRNESPRSSLNPDRLRSRFSVMISTDQETLIRAIEDARRILREYVAVEQRDPTRTVERLLAILDKNDVVHALDRMNRRRVIRLVD
ncbi:MAG: hypothetical protein QOF56_1359 [Acidobacteriaceae bacterium]|jgi:hypothetical protein|nr:hypothetical protein [Acidobacteriaceae bacterium]